MLSVRVASFLIATTILLNITSKLNATNATDSDDQRLEVKVYYEALCPDSVRFVRHQLYKAMVTKNLLKYTDLQFVPYGKVRKWVDPLTFEENLICQHGRSECEQNALQACIVEHKPQFEQMQMIDCLLGRYKINYCSDILNINVTAALECKRTRTTEDILKTYGEQTDNIDLWFVPSISIDGHFEPHMQNRILNEFSSVFCSKYKQKYNSLPTNCSQ